MTIGFLKYLMKVVVNQHLIMKYLSGRMSSIMSRQLKNMIAECSKILFFLPLNDHSETRITNPCFEFLSLCKANKQTLRTYTLLMTEFETK